MARSLRSNPSVAQIRDQSGMICPRRAEQSARVEALVMQGVMEAERRMGYEPRDVSAKKCGYESRVPGTGKLRFIEVKGRHVDGKTITVTKNETLTGLKADDFLLAIVQVDNGEEATPRYVRRAFGREPDFGVTSATYALTQFLREADRV